MYPPLYRYCKFSSENYDFKNLENDRFYFNSPTSYNDPYEGLLATDAIDIIEALIYVKILEYSTNRRKDLRSWKQAFSLHRLILNPMKNKTKIRNILDEFFSETDSENYDQTALIAMKFLYYDPYLNIFPYISYAYMPVDNYRLCIRDAIEKTSNISNEEKTYHLSRLISGYEEKYNIINNLRKQTSVLVPIILVDSIFNTPFKAKTYEETLVALNNVVKETFEIAKTLPEKFFLTNCLTENPNSILMWSHYADKHSGFCVEYDFNQADSSITDHLVKVKYSNKLVHLKKSSLIQMLHIKTTPNYIKKPKVTQLTHKTYAEAITTKNTVWKYEQEWRLIYKKSDENNIPNFPYATKIILGPNINETNKKLLIELSKKKDIPVFQAYLLPDHYSIGFYPIN